MQLFQGLIQREGGEGGIFIINRTLHDVPDLLENNDQERCLFSKEVQDIASRATKSTSQDGAAYKIDVMATWSSSLKRSVGFFVGLAMYHAVIKLCGNNR